MPPAKADVEAPPHEEGVRNPSVSNTHDGSTVNGDDASPASAAKLRNPLVGMSETEVLADVDAFVGQRGLSEYKDVFRKGALAAQMSQSDDGFEQVSALSEEDKTSLREEITHKWRQPTMLYMLCCLCAGSAIVQGSVVPPFRFDP